MTLAGIVAGHRARPFGTKDHVADSMTVVVDKAKEPKKGEADGRTWFSTMLTVSDGSGQDAIVFVNGEHRPVIGSQVTLEGVKFYSFERKAKEKGGGEWLNLGLTATGLTGSTQSASQPPSSPALVGSGDKDARIERQSARRDAVMLVAGMLANPDAKPMSEDAVMASVEKVYHFMLKITGTEPIQLPAPGYTEQSGQPDTFAEAAAAGAMLVKLVGGDQAKARQMFTNLTGAKTLSECPDKGCADGWLTIITNIKRSYEKLTKDDDKVLFVETLLKPGLTPDERDAELENILVGSALPF